MKAAVLDALVRLDAKVPGDLETDVVLHNAKGRGWRPALVLLSRNPERKQAIARWLDLRDWCVHEKLLTAEEAGRIEVPLTVEVRDKRKDKGEAIPELPPYREDR